MNTKKNKKKSILSTVEIKNKNSGLLVGKDGKVDKLDYEDIWAGGVVLDLPNIFKYKV